MKARGMNPDDTRVFKREQWPNELWNDWTPRIEDYKIIRKRIQEKIDMKPHWYRKTNYLQIIAEKACAICVFIRTFRCEKE